MWISNHTAPILCATIILPVVRDLPVDSRFSKALLLGLAYACNMGGKCPHECDMLGDDTLCVLIIILFIYYFILFILFYYLCVMIHYFIQIYFYFKQLSVLFIQTFFIDFSSFSFLTLFRIAIIID